MAPNRHTWPSLLDCLGAASPRQAEPGTEAAPKRKRVRQHHARLRTLKADVRRLPSIAKVCRHLGCDLMQFHAAGEPAWVFLGRGFSVLEESSGVRASPQFRSVEALEYFCRTHLNAFLAVERIPRNPRDWFWNRT